MLQFLFVEKSTETLQNGCSGNLRSSGLLAKDVDAKFICAGRRDGSEASSNVAFCETQIVALFYR